MSTEQQPATQQPATTPHPHATEAKHEPNALATGLANAWTSFKQGQLLSYPMMAAILLVILVGGGGWWYFHEQRKANSNRWREWDGLTSVPDMEKYNEEKQNKDTIQAKLTKLEIARTHLGPEGMDKMFVKATDFQQTSPLEAEKKARETRESAVRNVEKAREEFTKLVDEFKDDPVIKVECMLGCAKAEAVLVGIPKEGQLAERRGNPAKAVEWLDKVVEAAPDTDWGKDSKKLADALRNQNTQEQVATLQASLFDTSPGLPAPGFPGMPNIPGMPLLPPGHP